MTKSILIAGKDFPDGADFADGAQIKMRNVAQTISPELDATSPSNVKTVLWNRASPVSARTLLLDCESAFGNICEAVLYFDESYFALHFSNLSAQECSRATDEMILGFQYLTLEILSRFEKIFLLNSSNETTTKSRLVFLLKKSASDFDIKKNSSLRAGVLAVSNPFVAAASCAFESFAQNIASFYNEKNFVQIVLVTADLRNEVARTDRTLSQWLCSYLDELDAQKKNSQKQNVSWIKAGAKASGFLFFK